MQNVLKASSVGISYTRDRKIAWANDAIFIAQSGAGGDDVDLVVLDLIMPGTDGGKVFERLRELRPLLPVILSSGYSIDGIPAAIMKRGCNGFLQKPFNILELSRAVEKALNRAGGARYHRSL
jgi:FixJ family two-component response regulator